MALTPHALGPFTANDTFDSQLMEIQDSAGIKPWADFVGATVLRVLVDITCDPVLGNASAVATPDWQFILHTGVGMTEETVPSQDRWDPNDPHGDFMSRHTWGLHVQAREQAGARGITVVVHEGNVIRYDIGVRRRVREDEQMWMFAHYFERLGGGVDQSLALGYNGRVLLALP